MIIYFFSLSVVHTNKQKKYEYRFLHTFTPEKKFILARNKFHSKYLCSTVKLHPYDSPSFIFKGESEINEEKIGREDE